MHQQNGIYFLEYYHPYRNGNNKQFNEFSARILDLKDKKASGINYFMDKLTDIFRQKVMDTCLLTVVPPHTTQIKESGIILLAKEISKEVSKVIDGTSIIQRKHNLPKLSIGGNRSLYKHLSSLSLKEQDRLIGQKVIILDDIATSFNSMLACSQLLKTIRTKKIIPLALGRTKPEKLSKRHNAIIRV